ANALTTQVWDDVAPGGTATFSITLAGAVQTASFSIDFKDFNSGAVLGSIPVTIDCEEKDIFVGPDVCDPKCKDIFVNGTDKDDDILVQNHWDLVGGNWIKTVEVGLNGKWFAAKDICKVVVYGNAGN